MDVEQIQKINALALELMKQGLAGDRESAIQQAEEIYKGQQGGEEYSQMRETLQEVKEQKEEVVAPKEQNSDDLRPERVKEILKQNTDYIVKKLRDFQEKVDMLEKEMKELRNKIQYQKLPTVREVVSNQVPPPQPSAQEQPQAQSAPAQQQAAAPTPDQPGGNHPRSGSYNDQDVSIEKFFYMGK